MDGIIPEDGAVLFSGFMPFCRVFAKSKKHRRFVNFLCGIKRKYTYIHLILVEKIYMGKE